MFTSISFINHKGHTQFEITRASGATRMVKKNLKKTENPSLSHPVGDFHMHMSSQAIIDRMYEKIPKKMLEGT